MDRLPFKRLEEDLEAFQDRSGTDRPSLLSPWFAVQVRSRHEIGVANHLESMGYESFLPLYKSEKRWSDRLKEAESPLFPGYLFCRFHDRNWLPILKTPGVIQVVGYNRRPAPIDEVEIEGIRTVVASGLPSQPVPYAGVGDSVRIESGPLRGVEGIIVDFKNSRRFVVSITLLQRSVAVEIDPACVTVQPGSKLPLEEVFT